MYCRLQASVAISLAFSDWHIGLKLKVLLKSILVISGLWEGNNERLIAEKPNLWLKGFPSSVGF